MVCFLKSSHLYVKYCCKCHNHVMYSMCIDDCRNSTFINYYVLECDGINDCEDGNDELDCCEFTHKKLDSILYLNCSNVNPQSKNQPNSHLVVLYSGSFLKG